MLEKKHIYPTILTTIQLGSLVYILVTGPVIADSISGFLMEAAGIFLGLLSIYVMKPGNFNIRPLIKSGGILITSGPYRLIRHPMYTAQVVAIIPLVAESFSYWRLGVLIILVVDLLIKIEFEEKLLLQHFSQYENYKASSKKLIPFIY
ncbi:MAG: isoprenylcysteine carboxylmethyltransferase family protein [Chlorobi bacterium]|nr:isoprenylcysteine carboxylmethyltransferase family protein [Chlorobiota bacterium]